MAHRTSTSNTPLPLDYHTEDAEAFHLLSLPLFQGLSQSDLLRIAETTPLSFAQHPQGECIAKESEACRQLTVLFKGSVEVMAEADDHGYSLTETLKAPLVIEPEHLFGLHQHYRRTYTTAEACNTLSISKQHVITLTQDFMVFRLNLLNIICTQSQRLQRQPWHPQPTDLRQRIIYFFKDRSLRPAGEKVFKIKMVRLATELNASRLDISIALNAMQTDGLIKLTRGYITVPALERLT